MNKLDDDNAQKQQKNVNQLINIHKLENYQVCFAGEATIERKQVQYWSEMLLE